MPDKREKVAARNPRGRGIMKRVEIDQLMVQEIPVDHRDDVRRGTRRINEGKGRHRSGRNPQERHKLVSASEAQPPPRRLERALQSPDIEPPVLTHDNQHITAARIFQKEGLAMGARNVTAQGPTFLHCVERRVITGVMGDSDSIQERQKFPFPI